MNVESAVEPLSVVVRPAAPTELRWVCATWSRAMRATVAEDAAIAKAVRIGGRNDGVLLDASMLSRAHHYLVDALVAEATVVVAALSTLPDEPCGWVAYDGPVLHFCFVAPIARRGGVARHLVRPLGCSSASHMTRDGVVLTRYLRGLVD